MAASDYAKAKRKLVQLRERKERLAEQMQEVDSKIQLAVKDAQTARQALDQA